MRAFVVVFTALLLATRAYAHDEDSFEAEGSLGWTAAEKKSGHDQLLAMRAIKQLASINDGLNALAARDAAACNWMNQLTGPETLAKQINAFDANPAVKGVIEGENMTVRDYLLTLHAVSETAIVVHAAEQKIAVRIDVLPSNVAFYRQHRAEIERLLDGPDPC